MCNQFYNKQATPVKQTFTLKIIQKNYRSFLTLATAKKSFLLRVSINSRSEVLARFKA